MKKRRFSMKPRLKLMIALVFMGAFLRTFINQELLMSSQYEEMDSLEQQISETIEKNRDLESQIQFTESDEYVEKTARERLGWVKENEIIFKEKRQ